MQTHTCCPIFLPSSKACWPFFKVICVLTLQERLKFYSVMASWQACLARLTSAKKQRQKKKPYKQKPNGACFQCKLESKRNSDIHNAGAVM